MGLTQNAAGGAVAVGFNTNRGLEAFLAQVPGASGDPVRFTINDRTFRVVTTDNQNRIYVDTGGQTSTSPVVNRGANALTVQDMMNAINNSGAGVNLSFSNATGQFTLQTNQTGENTPSIVYDLGDGGFLQAIMGLNYTDANLSGAQNLGPQNAYFSLNGELMSRTTNNFNVDGLQISIGNNFTDLAGFVPNDNATHVGAQTFNIEVGRNTDDVRQMLVDFVEAYNELMQSMRELTETRRPRQDRDGGFFMPLTEEQRRSMSDREVELWEERARTGILHRDETLRAVQREMTDLMFRNITMPDGRTFNLGNAGIQLSRNPNEFGLLEIDEDRLAFALEHHLESVEELFTAWAPRSDFANDNAWLNASGLATRLNHIAERATNPRIGTITVRAGIAGGMIDSQSQMSLTISSDNRRIDNMLNWLQRREDSLFRQFSRMEMAMMQAQSQMMFFEQLMFQNM
jgi:flagellar hook-associated protein 2